MDVPLPRHRQCRRHGRILVQRATRSAVACGQPRQWRHVDLSDINLRDAGTAVGHRQQRIERDTGIVELIAKALGAEPHALLQDADIMVVGENDHARRRR